ncbi:MAG: cytidylyltransferase domain-containing protein [Fulvivirga sp.]
MDPIVVIPARAGSKGLPGKNTKRLAGKPLVQYTIEAALELFDEKNILVSTNDDEVINVAQSLGITVPFKRPEYLCTDNATTQDVLNHALQFFEKNVYSPNALILLQPTSPFRTAKNIREALNLFKKSIDMVVSVKETQSNPYYVLFEENKYGYLEKSKKGNFSRRQDCPKVWEYNGAIYIVNVSSLKTSTLGTFTRIRKYVMNQVASIDIDNELDWLMAESIMLNRS